MLHFLSTDCLFLRPWVADIDACLICLLVASPKYPIYKSNLSLMINSFNNSHPCWLPDEHASPIQLKVLVFFFATLKNYRTCNPHFDDKKMLCFCLTDINIPTLTRFILSLVGLFAWIYQPLSCPSLWMRNRAKTGPSGVHALPLGVARRT